MSGDAVEEPGHRADPPPVTVSLTTISSRIGQLERVVQSLLEQAPAPAHIMLAISPGPYLLDQGIPAEAVPAGLRRLEAQGKLEIVETENTGPYRKLLPALRRYAGQARLIVTADDDMIYPPHWLAGLIETYRQRRCVVAYRCRAMAVEAGSFLPYSRWQLLPADGDAFGELPPALHGLFTIATGVRGILYDTRFFQDPALLEELRALAPRQDDLAFKAATMCAGIPTALVDGDFGSRPFGRRLPPGGSEGESETLFHLNKKQNDAAWTRLTELLAERGLFRLSDALGGARPR